ncbi:MAG: hypothetical protein KBC56_08990 [Flavobacterium sp.]|nr:hypothetical protein [Flavobacterium sp.]
MSEIQKVDRFELSDRQEERAAVKIIEIENNSVGTQITFLKNSYQFKKIRERLTEPEFQITMGAMITKICALSGTKDKITPFDKDDIVNLIKTQHADLSPEEIFKAFEFERYEIYRKIDTKLQTPVLDKTEHYGLFNSAYVAPVLRKYKAWKMESKLNHNISAPMPVKNQLAQNSTASERETMNAGILRRFNQFKNGEKIETPLIGIYDDMWERKLFPADTDYAMFYKIAKRDIIAELKNLPPKSKEDFKEAKSVIENLIVEKSDESGKPILDGKVLARAKLYVLEHYFQKLIDDRIDINQILK